MNFSYCRSCGHRLAPGSPICKDCGTPAGAELQTPLREDSPSRATRLTTFFASQAALCLFTLLVFSGLVIALAPAGWRYVSLQLKSTSGPVAINNNTRSLGANVTPARCNQIVVIFNATASLARVSALLEQLDTTIAFGPNENGAFELSAPAAKAANVADALNRAADAVVSASLQRRCV